MAAITLNLDPITHLTREQFYDNGLRLGWLINPQDQQVGIYRPGRDVEILQFPVTLSGEDVLPGFILSL